MLKVYERLANDQQPVDEKLVLDQEQRKKGRLKAITESGKDIGLFLDRGKTLQVEEILVSECGQRILVEGAMESVATVTADEWLSFSKVCYHLGNRHVPLQVGELWMRFKPDHVLEDLAAGFGMTIMHEEDVFVPESGAYGHHHHHA